MHRDFVYELLYARIIVSVQCQIFLFIMKGLYLSIVILSQEKNVHEVVL